MHYRAKGWRMYGMDSKLKFGNQLKNFRTIKKNWVIYNLKSVIISCVLRVIVPKNIQSLYDEIFNIDRFAE